MFRVLLFAFNLCAAVNTFAFNVFREDGSKVDQLSVFANVDVPALIVQSGEDKNVSPENAHEMVSALSKTKPNITFKVFPSLNHYFHNAQGVDKTQSVTSFISEWINKRFQ